LAYFANTPLSDAVPTCVAKGPDGALYIGTLALDDFFSTGPGTATVYRVDPTKVDPTNLNTVLTVATPWATGFSTISACAFGPNGFYATEMFANDVVRVPFKTPNSGRLTIGAGVLNNPGGIAVRGSTIFVSNNSNSSAAGLGQVVRFGGV
jgi:sugar lactone lactonase YvrE